MPDKSDGWVGSVGIERIYRADQFGEKWRDGSSEKEWFAIIGMAE